MNEQCHSTPLILPPSEAASLHKGIKFQHSTLLPVSMPVISVSMDLSKKVPQWLVRAPGYPRESLTRYKVSWLPGDLVAVKEPWALPPYYNKLRHGDLSVKPDNLPVAYKADYPSGSPWANTKWKTANTLPDWAVRSFIRIIDVHPVPFHEVTFYEWLYEGIRLPFTPDCPAIDWQTWILTKRYQIEDAKELKLRWALQHRFQRIRQQGS